MLKIIWVLILIAEVNRLKIPLIIIISGSTFLYLIRMTKTLGNNSAQALKVVVNSNISIVVKKLVWIKIII